MRSPFTPAPASYSRRLGTLATSPASGPVIACSTSIVSSTLRAMGPSLSSDQQSVIAAVRRTKAVHAAAQARTHDAALGFAADRKTDEARGRRGARTGARPGCAFLEQPRIHRLAAEPDVIER